MNIQWKYKHLILLFFSIMAVLASHGQESKIWERPQKQLQTLNQKKAKVLKSQSIFHSPSISNQSLNHGISIEGRLNTNGWAFGTNLYFKRTNFISLTFSEIRHEKEEKQKNIPIVSIDNYPDQSNFIFGKINKLYLLNIGFGKETQLGPDFLSSSLSVKILFQGGLSMALLKPYYLNIIHTLYTPDPTYSVTAERYSPETSDDFLNPSDIQGASSWTKGLNQIKPIPGIFTDLSLRLLSSSQNHFLKGIAIGSNLSIYTRKLPIMADQKAYFYQVNAYVGFELGGRW